MNEYSNELKLAILTSILIIGLLIAHIGFSSPEYDDHDWNDAYKGGYVAGISGLPKETINPIFQENYDRGYANGLRINQSHIQMV